MSQSLPRWQTPTFRPLHPQLSCSAAAEMAASRKQAKYVALSGSHVFQPIALEILDQLTNRLCISVSADDTEGRFLFQRLSTLFLSAEIQRYLAA